MSSAVFVRGLRTEAKVGVTADERETPQALIVDLEARLDLEPAGISDDLKDTVDYGALVVAVDELVRAQDVALLERIAHVVLEHVLGIDGVVGATIDIRKERPPLDQETDGVGVRIRRGA